MVHGLLEPMITGPTLHDDFLFPALLGHGSDTALETQALIVSFRQQLARIGEYRRRYDHPNAWQGTQDGKVGMLCIPEDEDGLTKLVEQRLNVLFALLTLVVGQA